MGTTTTDDQFTWLRAAGFTGSMDDMLYAYYKTQTKSFLLGTHQDLRAALGLNEKPIPDPATRTPTNMFGLASAGNPSFASAVTGWAAQGSGVSLARVADPQFIGGQCGEITNATGGITAILRASVQANWIPAVSGKFYTGSGYVKWGVGTLKQARIDVRFLDATGTQLALQVGTLNTISAAAVTRIVNNDNYSPTGTAFIELRAVVPAAAASDTFRASNFFLEQGNFATAPPFN